MLGGVFCGQVGGKLSACVQLRFLMTQTAALAGDRCRSEHLLAIHGQDSVYGPCIVANVLLPGLEVLYTPAEKTGRKKGALAARAIVSSVAFCDPAGVGRIG